MSNPPRFIAGVPVRALPLEDACVRVCADATASRPRVYALVNAHSAKLRRDSREYATLLADTRKVWCLADGASVSAVGKLLGYGDVGRSPGPDLLEAVCVQAAEEDVAVFLLGGAEGVANVLAYALRSRNTGLAVAGTATPPFGQWSSQDNRHLVDAVKSSDARVLFIGVSAPKQEIWAYNHVEELGIPIVCVGAAFDFNSGTKQRAPEWMRRTGIEWVHRLLTEPGRMWRRYLVGNTLFLWDVVRYGRRPASH